jgi:hypothetical protein
VRQVRTVPSTMDTPHSQHAPVPRTTLCRHSPKVGARCSNSVRRDLCGGPPERALSYRDTSFTADSVPSMARASASAFSAWDSV